MTSESSRQTIESQLLRIVAESKGVGYIKAWVESYTNNSTADISGTSPSPFPSPPPTTRGRKPGTATTEVRCLWKAGDPLQCKNRYQTTAIPYCKIHAPKVAQINAVGASASGSAASAVSDAG
jgi:hypothetical protein